MKRSLVKCIYQIISGTGCHQDQYDEQLKFIDMLLQKSMQLELQRYGVFYCLFDTVGFARLLKLMFNFIPILSK
ncbi:DUF4288 domain-containing protein [Pedobacter sp. MC2016-14]|uniref:DUF4288 domain-containing protein n=1 Tax=Pedobacter sp. MC2016-14 TaxID=2897327 RepID=UPI001E3B95E9|nr:DUF4288 domain-containing protein [Pedobacter sp. MC2016-14]MCD0488773.1 DUF4288 domain-containing protein [Pedobacter sp. MC2016-14]